GEAEYLSILYSMPRFLVEMWLKTYDVDTLKRILHGLLEERPVTIRIDETLSSEAKKELLASMEACGIAVQLHPYLPYAYEVKNMTGVSTLPGFAEGEVMIQDVSSMLAVQAAGIREHDHILDVCAAPGGKSLHMACKLRGTGLVEALDVSDYKVNMIQENIDRMGYHNITASVEDATRQQSTRIQSADIVLADVPCSGLGVIAKKSDIKYRVTEQSLTEITVLQKAIIHNVQAYVKPGGILLYSTCTIHDTENEEMIRWIQEQYPFELESIDPYIDEVLQSETTARGYLQILPDIHQADGFFLARLRRKRS
ncbi:MAG: 16S rRNA (cytosine(967)-C(5))-methyltransferase RsmB, partial [Lachnospiraceae bacterium]